MVKQNYDAVIIGGGHNSLACGIHLVHRGWSVLIVETCQQLGGAVKTQEITADGFKHDLYAMNISLFAGSPFFAKYSKDLFAHGLGCIESEKTFASVFPDGSFVGVEKNLENTLKNISKLNVDDAKKWQALFHDFSRDAPYIFSLLSVIPLSFSGAKTIATILYKKGFRWALEFLNLLLSSPREWLDKHIKDEKIKTMMSAWGMHLDFSPDIAGGALFPYLECMANQAFGMVLGKGGAYTIIESMESLFREKGGEIQTATRVEKIHVKNGSAQSVLLATGEIVHAKKAVIANTHPVNLYSKLIDQSLITDNHPFFSFKPGLATLMIHYALDSLPSWSAGEELSRYAYVHIAPSMDAMSKTYTQAMAGELPEEPVLVVGQPSAIDDSRAPEGKHVLWVQVRVVPYEIQRDALGEIQSQSWDIVKEQYANRVEKVIANYAPGWEKNIIQRTVLSPVDLYKDNENLYRGDSLAGSHHLNQFLLFRPTAKYSRYNTDFKKLHIIGASTHPGAGLGAGSGFILAKKLGGK